MASNEKEKDPKILILATLAGGYAGAYSTGHSHLGYLVKTYILPVMSLVMFTPAFFVRAFKRGIDGITIMYSGTNSLYKVKAKSTAALINRTYGILKERNLDIRRLRLATICTGCVKPFLKEVKLMTDLLDGIGFVKNKITALVGA